MATLWLRTGRRASMFEAVSSLNLKDGRAVRRVTAGGAVWPFDPVILFANGERGVWLDPSDLSTMFVDLAGTTPVTTDGELVGYMVDKANSQVFTAPTDAARPTYRTDGVLHWLVFDGTDSLLETAAFTALADPVDGFMAVLAADYPIAVSFGQYDFAGVDNRVWRFDEAADNGNQEFSVQPNDDFSGGRTARVTGTFSGPRVLAGTWQGDGTISTLAVNRSNLFVASDATTLNTIISQQIQLGAISGDYYEFDFYGAIVRDVYNSTSVEKAEDWAAGKAGVAL